MNKDYYRNLINGYCLSVSLTLKGALTKEYKDKNLMS